jgi:hypothetical protein
MTYQKLANRLNALKEKACEIKYAPFRFKKIQHAHSEGYFISDVKNPRIYHLPKV